MPNTFFTSDTHYGHKNIIKYCNRPYATTEEMNEDLITKWNEKVKPADTVYHLGDVSWLGPKETQDILKRLSGHKHLILGNHDNIKNVVNFFETTQDYLQLRMGKQISSHIVMMHYPIGSWDKKNWGSIHLHGHTHGGYQEHNVGLRRIDVGVDCWGMYPVSIGEINDLVMQRDADHDRVKLDGFDKLCEVASKDDNRTADERSE